MLAAASDKRIRALVLLGAPGTTGAAINIERIKHRLDRSNLSDPEKQSLLELQKKIQAAVLAGSGLGRRFAGTATRGGTRRGSRASSATTRRR